MTKKTSNMIQTSMFTEQPWITTPWTPRKRGRPVKQDRTIPTEKICTKCGKRKPITDYSKLGTKAALRRVDPFMSECKHCEKLRRFYKMTAIEYEAILIAQGGGCAICGTTENNTKGKMLVVDHDHKTGKIRGLLCGLCNMGLGGFRDDEAKLKKAVRYLKAQQIQAMYANNHYHT